MSFGQVMRRCLLSRTLILSLSFILCLGLMLYGAYVAEKEALPDFNPEQSLLMHLPGKSVVPKWMPTSWQEGLYRELQIEGKRPVLGRETVRIRERLQNSNWINSVTIRCNFRGETEVRLMLNRPIFAFAWGNDIHYSNAAGGVMKMLAKSWKEGGDHVLDEQGKAVRIPLADVSVFHQIKDPVLRDKWLKDLAEFVLAWRDEEAVSERLKIETMKLDIHSASMNRVCLLSLRVRDSQQGSLVPISWGVNSTAVNVLENRNNRQKFEDLKRILRQSKGRLEPVELNFQQVGSYK